MQPQHLTNSELVNVPTDNPLALELQKRLSEVNNSLEAIQTFVGEYYIIGDYIAPKDEPFGHTDIESCCTELDTLLSQALDDDEPLSVANHHKMTLLIERITAIDKYNMASVSDYEHKLSLLIE